MNDDIRLLCDEVRDLRHSVEALDSSLVRIADELVIFNKSRLGMDYAHAKSRVSSVYNK